MEKRMENKFYGNKIAIRQIINNLMENGMKEEYNERWNNSIYFDNKKLELFEESEEGIAPRSKIRIRNYITNQSKELKQYQLEIKKTDLNYEYKIKINIAQEEVNKLTANGIFDKKYGLLKPLTEILYKRKYYNYKGIIVTHDKNIQYKRFTNINGKNEKIVFEKYEVLEFKINLKYLDSVQLSEIMGIENLRFSKYCRSIELLKLSKLKN